MHGGSPLNGTKTHPLTAHAKSALSQLWHGPMPRQQINPGVVNRLEREELVRNVMLDSPYVTSAGKKIQHLEITEAGRQIVRAMREIGR